jgi:hypothetical protein
MSQGNEGFALEKPEGAVIGPTKSPTRLHDLIEHGLQAGRTGECAKDAADRLLLLAQRIDLTRELVYRSL